MSFSNSELQQLKSLLADQIRLAESDKTETKMYIGDLVKCKKPFKDAGTKAVVDIYNDQIRKSYKYVDSLDRKLKKLRTLQISVKREMADQVSAGRVEKAATGLVTTLHGLIQQKQQEAPQTTGYVQVEPRIVDGKVVSLSVVSPCGLQSSGVSPSFRGWQDNVMENFHPTSPSFINPDPSYDQPALDKRRYTVPSTLLKPTDPAVFYPNRILNPDCIVEQRSTDNTTKPSNPKDLIGSGKLPIHLWPNTATAMGCIGFLNGMLKYGRANFRVLGIRASIYYDAAKRHLDAWFEGEECDPDDGVPHLAAALACIAIIVDAIAADKLNDDRQVKGGYRKLVDQLTPHVARLKALHASKDPHHYTIADNASLV